MADPAQGHGLADRLDRGRGVGLLLLLDRGVLLLLVDPGVLGGVVDGGVRGRGGGGLIAGRGLRTGGAVDDRLVELAILWPPLAVLPIHAHGRRG